MDAESSARIEIAIRDKIATEVTEYRKHLEAQFANLKWAISVVVALLAAAFIFFFGRTAVETSSFMRGQVTEKIIAYRLQDQLAASVNQMADFEVKAAEKKIRAAVAAAAADVVRIKTVDPLLDRALKASLEKFNKTQLSSLTASPPVGTIIGSVLDESAFSPKGAQKPIWVLADGRDVSTSAYSLLSGKSTVPDLRGVFLRGLNAGRTDEFQDPDGALRAAGDLQKDALGTHAHETYGNASSGVANGGNSNYLTTISRGFMTGSAGGPETRPKNAAVYFYIKIN